MQPKALAGERGSAGGIEAPDDPDESDDRGPVVLRMHSLDHQMIGHMKFLQHLRDAWLRHAANAHVLEHCDTCPHCEERTTWTVRMLSGYARCQQCGQNPLERPDPVPVERQRRTTLQPEPHVSA